MKPKERSPYRVKRIKEISQLTNLSAEVVELVLDTHLALELDNIRDSVATSSDPTALNITICDTLTGKLNVSEFKTFKLHTIVFDKRFMDRVSQMIETGEDPLFKEITEKISKRYLDEYEELL